MSRLRSAIAAFVAIAGCVACTRVGRGPAAGEHNAFTIPGVLRIAAAADPKNLNPLLDSAQPVLELSAFLFSWSVLYDAHGQPHPEALREIPTVANGDVSRDGLTLRYKLRRNMTWHDGVPVTCRDLRFTWSAVMNRANNVVTTDGYSDIRSIDCSDRYVAVVHLRRIYAPFLQQLWGVNGNAPILPEHLLAEYNDAKGSLNTAPYNAAPVGSGPFAFVSWTRGQSVHLRAYPNFYLGRPKLTDVYYEIIGDSNTLLTQIKTHAIDLYFHARFASWDTERNIPGIVAIDPPIFSYDHLDFNLNRPLLADLRVREALAFALDRPTMLQKAMHGLGVLSETDESPRISEAYTNDVAHHRYDPARARALLDAAGWRPGRDGIRVRDGTRLSFTLATQTENTDFQEIETLVARYWHDVGVEAVIKNQPTSVFFENDPNGVLQGGKYDVALFNWTSAADPDDSPIYSAHNLPPRGQNTLFWRDAIATHAMDDALQTVDMRRRIADYHVVQQRLASQLPTIVLWFRNEPQLYNSDLKGFTATPVITTPFWDTWNYSL